MEEDTNQDTFTKPSPPQTNGSDTLGSQAKDIRDLEERIGYCLRTFDEAPFTIQRIAELLLWPEKHYKSVLKFLRAVERVVYVTSTVEEFPLTTSIRKDDDDAAIEDGGGTGAPDSLYSFIASTSLANNGMTNGIQTMTKAVAPKAVTSRAVAPRSVMPRVSTAEEAKTPAATVAPAATGNVPMDASDTGILHITPTSNDDADALKTKIQDSVDPDVPVYIDDHDGGSSKLTVQPVFPSAAADPKAESPEAMVEDDS
ncbi:hypothetical protein GGI07_000568 [Coemansia sp. Benny D115]|nr:hypothetical protein GGI07_000568 [Coemansia sp. Benny D115]